LLPPQHSCGFINVTTEYCWLCLLTCKNRLPYNLYCVGGDVKHCSIQSNDSVNLFIFHESVWMNLLLILRSNCVVDGWVLWITVCVCDLVALLKLPIVSPRNPAIACILPSLIYFYHAVQDYAVCLSVTVRYCTIRLNSHSVPCSSPVWIKPTDGRNTRGQWIINSRSSNNKLLYLWDGAVIEPVNLRRNRMMSSMEPRGLWWLWRLISATWDFWIASGQYFKLYCVCRVLN